MNSSIVLIRLFPKLHLFKCTFLSVSSQVLVFYLHQSTTRAVRSSLWTWLTSTQWERASWPCVTSVTPTSTQPGTLLLYFQVAYCPNFRCSMMVDVFVDTWNHGLNSWIVLPTKKNFHSTLYHFRVYFNYHIQMLVHRGCVKCINNICHCFILIPS